MGWRTSQTPASWLSTLKRRLLGVVPLHTVVTAPPARQLGDLMLRDVVTVAPEASTFVAANNNTVADLVQALAKMRVSTRDVISILQAVKAAGALHAELIVQ